MELDIGFSGIFGHGQTEWGYTEMVPTRTKGGHSFSGTGGEMLWDRKDQP